MRRALAGTTFAAAAFRVLLGITALLCLASAVMADDAAPDVTSLQAKKEALFAQMLKDPANLDVTFAYADVAAQLGDNEAAVAALERMLLFNPDLPRVDLELGVLYYRMGSFEAAQSYFDKALSFNPPEEVATRVNEYLAKIHSAEQPGHLTGYLFLGSQYQTDANVAPGSPLIHSPVGDVLLSNEFVKHSDFNIFATGAALYSYDLGTQNRDTLELTGTGFANHYMQFSRLDLDLGELTAGPRFRVPDVPIPNVSEVTVKPYGIVNEVGLGEAQYFFTYGAGLETTGVIMGDVSARVAYEFRNKNFSNAATRPLSRGLTGYDNLLIVSATKPLTYNSALSLEFDYLDQSTRLDYYANVNYAISAAYRIQYDDPTGLLHLPWETAPFLSRSWAIYQGPDPCCNTSGTSVFSPSSRDDRRWRFGITQGVHITDNIELIVQAERDIVSSNLPLYGYTSNSVVVGPQIRF